MQPIRILLLITFMALTAFVSSCTTAPSTSLDPSINAGISQVIWQSETEGEDIQQFDLDNCFGKADAARTETRSSSFNITVSNDLAAKIGASAEFVSAEVQTAVGKAITVGDTHSTEVQLKAPPATHMYFQIAWRGKERVGVVQNVLGSGIPVAFRVFTPNDFRIKSQYDIGCQTVSVTSPASMGDQINPDALGGEQVQQVPPPAAPESTLIPSNVGKWLYSINQVPSAGSQVTWELNSGEVLILTGGRARYRDFYCGDNQYQICVVIIHASGKQSVTITDLIAQNSWLGATSTMSSEQTLSEIQPWFWKSPNCGNGCSKATIAFFENGNRTDTRIIQK